MGSKREENVNNALDDEKAIQACCADSYDRHTSANSGHKVKEEEKDGEEGFEEGVGESSVGSMWETNSPTGEDCLAHDPTSDSIVSSYLFIMICYIRSNRDVKENFQKKHVKQNCIKPMCNCILQEGFLKPDLHRAETDVKLDDKGIIYISLGYWKSLLADKFLSKMKKLVRIVK